MRSVLIWLLAGCLAAAAGAAYVLDNVQYPPREVGRYTLHRAAGHNVLINAAARYLSALLDKVDRVSDVHVAVPLGWVGASPLLAQGDARGSGHNYRVTSMGELFSAINSAKPGDLIQLEPGRYRIDGYGIRITRAGLPDAPIIMRSAKLGEVILESTAQEAVKVSAPHWHFENLILRGDCGRQNDSYCEHAFHVVGAARGTVIHNNVLLDFNAQVKINGEGGDFPDDGIIERNTLTDSRPRETSNPVTPVDLDAASGWRISGNLISDFGKAQGNGISYGAYAKGAGSHNVFQRNVIICEDRLQNVSGERVGLSLGGGGSSAAIRRDNGGSGLEQDQSEVRDNLIAFCNDAGIYVNRASRSLIEHNTLLDTSGIIVRFPQSTARVEANIVDGLIVARDGALTRGSANIETSGLELYLGFHPARDLFVDPSRLDLRWKKNAPRAFISGPGADLCGRERLLPSATGAFENFADCLSASRLP